MPTHWKSLTERDFIYAFDLNGKDVTVTIRKVVQGELTSTGGRKTKKPVVYFEGKEKGLALNSTNAKTIASLYGNYVEKWAGQSVTLFPTTTQMGGETVECIRIRPQVPRAKQIKNTTTISDAPETEEQKIARREREEANQ